MNRNKLDVYFYIFKWLIHEVPLQTKKHGKSISFASTLQLFLSTHVYHQKFNPQNQLINSAKGHCRLERCEQHHREKDVSWPPSVKTMENLFVFLFGFVPVEEKPVNPNSWRKEKKKGQTKGGGLFRLSIFCC